MDKKEKQNKAVLILGDFIHEGVETSISSLGFRLIKRNLYRVTPKTWEKRIVEIKKLLSSNELSALIIYLPTPIFLFACQSKFVQVWNELITESEKCHSILFAYEPNLNGEFRFFDKESGQLLSSEELENKIDGLNKSLDLEEPQEDNVYNKIERLRLTVEHVYDAEQSGDEIARFLQMIYGSEIQICPFKSRADVTLRIEEFLEEVKGGIFLRLYVPNGRWQADQLSSFLDTFKRYLREIEQKSFAVDTRHTDNGIIYLFRAEEAIADLQNLEFAIGRFDHFMRLCRDTPTEALKLFKSQDINGADVDYHISRYAKAYQRLLLDTRHEFEHKSLLLRQRFEAGMIEIDSAESLKETYSGSNSLALCLTGNSGPISINLTNVATNGDVSVQNEVSRIINGNVVYNENDQKLLDLFKEFADNLQSIQLRSDLDQLKDTSTPINSKKTAKQRILSFIYRIGSKAGDAAIEIGIKALQVYLESLVNSG